MTQPVITCACTEIEATDMCALCQIVAWYVGGFTVPDPSLTEEQEKAVRAFIADPGDDNCGPTYEAMRAVGLPAWGTPRV